MHLQFKRWIWEKDYILHINRIINATQRMECVFVNSTDLSFFASMCLITYSYYCNQHHSNIFDVSYITINNAASNEYRVTDTKTTKVNQIILNMQFTPQIPQLISLFLFLFFFLILVVLSQPLEPWTLNIQHWTHQVIVCLWIESDEPCIQCFL